MSRLRSNTVNAPAVGRSSNAIARPNSLASTQVPDGPLTCTACASTAPQSASTRSSVTPYGYSYSPGRAQSPDTDRILVPDERGVPTARYHSPPCTATSAAAHSVSTLLTMVGWPRYPCVTGYGGRLRGTPRLPSSDSI